MAQTGAILFSLCLPRGSVRGAVLGVFCPWCWLQGSWLQTLAVVLTPTSTRALSEVLVAGRAPSYGLTWVRLDATPSLLGGLCRLLQAYLGHGEASGA